MQVPTEVEAILDTNVEKRVAKAQRTQKENFKSEKRQGFSVGGTVIAKDYSVAGKVSWTKAKVVKILGSQVYLIEMTGGKTWKRHANQLISCNAKMPDESNEEIYIPTTILNPEKATQEPAPLVEDTDPHPTEDDSGTCSRYNLRPRKGVNL